MSSDEVQIPYLNIERQGDILNITFMHPHLTEEDNIDELGHLLFSQVDQHHVRQVVLNLAHVQFLTSSVIGKMITLHRKLHRNQGYLVLCSLTDRVTEVLNNSRLLDYFQITSDPQSASERIAVLINSNPDDNISHTA
ncbi:MAG: STAS domain-containing protein [Planctomycetaceae bacterium]